MAVAASPKLWMVSESKATLPDISTTTSCKRAVAMSPKKDHLMAQIPRSEVAMVGSTAPWVWPCSPCPWGWACRCSSLRSCFMGVILPSGVDYSPECVGGEFCEPRVDGVLRSSDVRFLAADGSRPGMAALLGGPYSPNVWERLSPTFSSRAKAAGRFSGTRLEKRTKPTHTKPTARTSAVPGKGTALITAPIMRTLAAQTG